MLTHDRSARTGVIEVDMGQEDVADVRPADPIRLQAELERREAAGRAGINDRHAVMALDQYGGDHSRASLELQIDP
jgi:hypothetical protein